jgi:hypothetical protein
LKLTVALYELAPVQPLEVEQQIIDAAEALARTLGHNRRK